MKTLGIDFAVQPENTAWCEIEWNHNGAIICDVKEDCHDYEIISKVGKFGNDDKCGIDVPFGWPTDFVSLIQWHQVSADDLPDIGETLWLRKTDINVRDKIKKTPLSVAADKIGRATGRAAWLLRSLGIHDRSGKECCVEVYPAASLKRWGLQSHGYKGKNKAKLGELVSELCGKMPNGLKMGKHLQRIRESDNVFDALVASLTTRAFCLGLVEPIPDNDARTAEREGWIALPLADSLHKLCNDSASKGKHNSALAPKYTR
ncbi:MAG: DUF429 domain-containing protein [Acidobacteriales bacterium]|nr:DUF429 domain-containing protein [Terriglobales bacterium]